MCYRYAVLQGLKTFANGIHKWFKHLTDFPTPRFQTPDWQVQCLSVLTEIYSHLCLTDIAVKTALIDSGPRPFTLHCLAPWGALIGDSSTVLRSNLVSDILVETRVHLITGKLTSSDWLQPGHTRTGLQMVQQDSMLLLRKARIRESHRNRRHWHQFTHAGKTGQHHLLRVGVDHQYTGCP